MTGDEPRRAWRAAAGVLLSVAAVSCTSSGAVSSQAASRGPLVTPVHMTASPSPAPTGPVPVLNGCPSGVVAITYHFNDGDSTVCVRAGARLRLFLTDDGYGTWNTLQVTPAGAASVASTTDSKGNVSAVVTPAGTAPFCLGTTLMAAVSTSPDYLWRLCVTIRR